MLICSFSAHQNWNLHSKFILILFGTFFFYHPLSKTWQGMHKRIVKYYCSCSINGSLKDYQRPCRSKAYTWNGIPSRSDSTWSIFSIYWFFFLITSSTIFCLTNKPWCAVLERFGGRGEKVRVGSQSAAVPMSNPCFSSVVQCFH